MGHSQCFFSKHCWIFACGPALEQRSIDGPCLVAVVWLGEGLEPRGVVGVVDACGYEDASRDDMVDLGCWFPAAHAVRMIGEVVGSACTPLGCGVGVHACVA